MSIPTTNLLDATGQKGSLGKIMAECIGPKVFLILVSLVMAGCFIPPVISAANGNGNGSWPGTLAAGPDLNITNYTFTNETIPAEYRVTREPIKLQLELNQTTLPGPRYMAFGPSYIGVWIDPVVLVVLLIIAVFVVCLVYYIRRTRHEKPGTGLDDNDANKKNE
jgi:hypothetical protein